MPLDNLKVIKTTAEQILSHPTWDLISLFALVAIGFFYGISVGKRMIISTIIYTYVALALMPLFPFQPLSEALQVGNLFFLKIGVFLGAYILLVFFLGRGGAQSYAVGNPWWQVFLLSFLQAGLLINIVLGFLPADKIKMLAPVTRTFFANPDLKILWLAGPLVVLIIIRWIEYRHEKRW